MMLSTKLATRKPFYRNLASHHPLLPTGSDPSSSRFYSPPAAAVKIPTDSVSVLKEWFRSSSDKSLDRVFKLLDDPKPGLMPGVRVSERFVLEALEYGKTRYGILSCLKLFDWAGRQPGFFHTRTTFHAVFKILSKAKLMSLMEEFLDGYVKERFLRSALGFRGTVVMGYALAGQVHLALHLFANMRFQGMDLNSYVYNILLNALVEEGCFQAADVVSKHIFRGGKEDEVTHSIMVKMLCKEGRVKGAEAYLRETRHEHENGRGLSLLVDTLCQGDQFDKAQELILEFEDSGAFPMDFAYGTYVKNLARVERVNDCLLYLENKKLRYGFIPNASLYNYLLFQFLKLNRAKDVYDLLFEMQENGVLPNRATMSAVLCFFCKVGMADIALDLYHSKSDFGLSLDSMAYNYLINSLCMEGSVDKAYYVLENSEKQGYVLWRNTLANLAYAVCREGKLDKMKPLFFAASKQNFATSCSAYEKFISEFCRAGRVEDGHLIFSELSKMNKVARRDTYASLIRGFGKSNRGDIAAGLLLEMQEKGYNVSRALFKTVTGCLLQMENSEKQFLKLLEIQLHLYGSSAPSIPQIYNHFIEGAGRMKKPELARKVLEMMQEKGVQPTTSSDVLMLQSYLRNERIWDALNFVDELQQRRKIGRSLCNTMVVGLCQMKRVGLALHFMKLMEQRGVTPSSVCHDAVIFQLCKSKSYDEVLKIVCDQLSVRRKLTSYTGNVLLYHSLSSERFCEVWDRVILGKTEVPASISTLHELIHMFSSRSKITVPIERLEAMIEQCFPMELYTYNMLMRRLSLDDMELACKVFIRIVEKGWEPNKWAFHIIVHGYLRQGMRMEASKWRQEMEKRGFRFNLFA